jgi:hypothetical protein
MGNTQKRGNVAAAVRRGIFCRLAALLVLLAGMSAGNAAPPAPTAGPTAVIDGFRTARFGMNEAQLRAAIRKDFPRAAGRLVIAVQPTEKTTVLSLTADLLPDTGPARISYILGYRSKRLIEVNIVWTSDGRSAASDQAVVATANALRDYFASENFPPDSVVRNRKLADDAILVFRARDDQGRMVVLLLSGVAASARHGRQAPPLTLELSYIEDSAHPDVFRIPRGRF